MNIVVAGVGGQGAVLFSNILSEMALTAGLDVKKSEVHGMAQRGGSVTTHVRYAPKVYSPMVEEGTADLLVAFERLEALRYVHLLSKTGRLVYDPYRLDPLPVKLGMVERPEDARIDERVAARAPERLAVPAFDIALELGEPRVQNVVMLGAVSRFLDFSQPAYQDAIKSLVKPRFVELNLRAFERGVSLARATA